ncbi:MFS transporter [Streptantibioticus parmotrematis]|uniref:MFS transporter n=1 Tax=Streptantibioticus parmotrematis TaxID=2873249 RepID=UPI0033DDE21C
MNENTRIATSPVTPRAERGPAAPAAAPRPGRAWLRAAVPVVAIGWGAQQFTPLLLLYQARLHLSATTVQATFVPYVIGLIPGLMFGGPCSDRFGRRKVMLPTVVLSVLGTVLLIVGANGLGFTLAGRLVSGMASGAGFSCGGAWIKELSASSGDTDHGPRRLTVSMGIGFGLGPLVAGVLAQWAPDPTLIAYLPHLLICAAAFACLLTVPETLTPSPGTSFLRNLRIHEVRERRFVTVVLPLAPWVFIAVAVAVGYLPGLVAHQISGDPLMFSALVVVANAGAGIFVQPLARRLHTPPTPRLLGWALAIVVGGMLVAALAAWLHQPALVLVASLVLGAGYGCCQFYGLTQVQQLASPEHLAGLTATYQAVTYVGMMASYPLAAIGSVVPAPAVLLGVAVLAALTLAWTTRAAAVRTTTPSGASLPA